MHAYRRAALAALVPFAFVGCAHVPANQPMSRDVAAAIQPVDVKIGIKQQELYADFERSTAGAAAAAGCGAVPGIGILLAAACGGATAAVDGAVNASRAKTADEMVRPLKDEIIDVKFDQLMTESVRTSLQGVSGMQLSGVATTKTVDNKAYEETLRASTSSAVMFVNVDYHVSRDFSTLEVSARGLVYPRSPAARTAAKLPAELSTDSKEPVLALKNSVYRINLFYHAKLPMQSANPSDYIAAWKADGARLLRSSLNGGAAQLGRLLAEDMQHAPGAERPSLRKVEASKGWMVDLIAEADGGQLLRYPDGSMHFKTTLSSDAASAAAAAPKATAATSAVTTVQ